MSTQIKLDGVWVTVAGGHRMWVGTKAARDAALAAGKLPDGTSIMTTDDYTPPAGEWNVLDILNKTHTSVVIPDTAKELVVHAHNGFYHWMMPLIPSLTGNINTLCFGDSVDTSGTVPTNVKQALSFRFVRTTMTITVLSVVLDGAQTLSTGAWAVQILYK